MRISDWSSDVCSSDLGGIGARRAAVACRRDEADGSIWLETSHDGYLPVFGLTHHRRLFLSASGDDLRGEDRFTAETSGAARPCDVALRFHLHPEVQAMARSEEHTSELQSLMRISYAVFCLKKKNNKQHKSKKRHKKRHII